MEASSGSKRRSGEDVETEDRSKFQATEFPGLGDLFDGGMASGSGGQEATVPDPGPSAQPSVDADVHISSLSVWTHCGGT